MMMMWVLCVYACSLHEASEHRSPNAVNESRMIPMKHLCDPALDPSWKESFDILGALDFAPGLFNKVIHAHPPYRVRHNVYEFSRRLPDTLKFELVSCGENWASPFNDILRAKKI
ncbi:putative flavonoid 3'-monooxygenase-like [Capsicum annuum]|nr:putative flavonoid 3'-monooxygenase-like [Capsicum annuum]